MNSSRREPRLRVGDLIVVRSRAEILQTLGADACVDGLPFMPEMFQYCEKRFRVWKIAHKTCDTVNPPGQRTGGRWIRDCVHLEGLRCDGSDHGGCQAACLLFWKEIWLRRVDVPNSANHLGSPAVVAGRGEDLVQRAAIAIQAGHDTEPVYRCQATELLKATRPLKWWDMRQYIADVISGNHTLRHVIGLLVHAAIRNLIKIGVGYRILVGAYNKVQGWRGKPPFPDIPDAIPKGAKTPTEMLDLRPGELVRIKSHAQIRSTTAQGGFNRGMRFDEEMISFCGQTARVRARVDKIIDESNGKMMHMKNPCIILEDVYCRAECSTARIGCPRAIYSYWREIWLERVDESRHHPPST
jgi:hypothetical protein